MGRRSRKRPAPPIEERRIEPPPVAARPVPPPRGRRARLEEAPPAPWSPFPLVELCILGGIVLMIVGFVERGHRGGVLVVCGVALVGVASLELSIREHLAGYRSHSGLLALAAAVAAIALVAFAANPPRAALVGVGAVVFAIVFFLLRGLFRRRTGGMAFRA